MAEHVFPFEGSSSSSASSFKLSTHSAHMCTCIMSDSGSPGEVRLAITRHHPPPTFRLLLSLSMAIIAQALNPTPSTYSSCYFIMTGYAIPEIDLDIQWLRVCAGRVCRCSTANANQVQPHTCLAPSINPKPASKSGALDPFLSVLFRAPSRSSIVDLPSWALPPQYLVL